MDPLTTELSHTSSERPVNGVNSSSHIRFFSSEIPLIYFSEIPSFLSLSLNSSPPFFFLLARPHRRAGEFPFAFLLISRNYHRNCIALQSTVAITSDNSYSFPFRTHHHHPLHPHPFPSFGLSYLRPSRNARTHACMHAHSLLLNILPWVLLPPLRLISH